MDVLLRLLLILAVFAINAVVGHFTGRGIQAGDSLAFCVTYSFIIIYLLYTWKSKLELLTRCALAAPLAVAGGIILRALGFQTVSSVLLGLGLFLFLIMETRDWKVHFMLTLTVAAVFAFLLVFHKYIDREEDARISQYQVYLIFGLVLPFMVFYGLYISAIDSKSVTLLRPLVVRSAKFTGILFVFFTLFIASERLCRHHQLRLPASFAISLLIALCFLASVRWLKLSLSDNSVNDKNNDIKPKELTETFDMRRFALGGKDGKSAKTGKCEFCGRAIYSSEVSYAIKDHTVCGQCYNRIEDEKTRGN